MIQHILLYIEVISATSIVIKDNSNYKMGEVVNETLSETSAIKAIHEEPHQRTPAQPERDRNHLLICTLQS